ncbi:uncharacterized protein LOC118424326 [Branchiostoma floridae]|uniref:Uncharacterized protein LOC118424326 n=1 Tax=Branchiostoma floridae TaxID=7739 RepID=A0A9J7LUC6_BRAFL|nr:uncharacterized protein LOC118424326 [Branchiostoma floridae]
MSGDVAQNPGPKDPCGMCSKSVRNNQKGICCDLCDKWFHIKCIDMDHQSYCNLANSHEYWYCNQCLLPYFSDSFFNSSHDSTMDSSGEDNVDVCPSSCHMVPPTKGLTMGHLNICSLYNKLDQLRVLMTSNNIDVMTLSETHLDDTISDAELHIAGYYLYRLDRNRSGGGVAIYVSEAFTHSRRSDLQQPGLEALFCQINLPCTKPIIAGSVYRPPSAPVEFYTLLDNSLETLSLTSPNSELYLLGDFNVDLTQPRKPPSKALTNLTEKYQLRQLINEPTRVHQYSSTLIDHIYCSDMHYVNTSGVVQCTISDHYAVFCTRKAARRHSGVKYVSSRKFTKFDEQNYLADLSEIDWSPLYHADSVDDAWTFFKSSFTTVSDLHAPFITKRTRDKQPEWLSPNIRKQMLVRNDLKAKARKTG